MIKIKKYIIDSLIEHARKDVPIEACGYLAGKDGVITKQYKLKNIDNSAEHFSFDPKEQFEVMKMVRAEGLEIITNYHSHPSTPARPSEEDISLAFDPEISYVIISLAQEKIDIKSFRIINSQVEKEEILIIE